MCAKTLIFDALRSRWCKATVQLMEQFVFFVLLQTGASKQHSLESNFRTDAGIGTLPSRMGVMKKTEAPLKLKLTRFTLKIGYLPEIHCSKHKQNKHRATIGCVLHDVLCDTQKLV